MSVMDTLERVPLERISAEARQIEFRRVLLLVIGGLLFGVGWVAAKTFTVVWAGLVWSAMAVKVGWQEGRSRVEASGGG